MKEIFYEVKLLLPDVFGKRWARNSYIVESTEELETCIRMLKSKPGSYQIIGIRDVDVSDAWVAYDLGGSNK